MGLVMEVDFVIMVPWGFPWWWIRRVANYGKEAWWCFGFGNGSEFCANGVVGISVVVD